MWINDSILECEKKLHSNTSTGLTEKEALKRQTDFGKNKLEDAKKKNIILKFFDQFKDFMIIVLLIAATISALLSYFQNSHEYMDSVIIIAIVVFNAIMGLIQEEKAEKSLDALKKLTTPSAKVKRNSKIITIASEDVVPGDIIILEAGNYVCADARLIKSFNLKIEESALTGETLPVEKNSNIILDEKVQIADMTNMVFSTTIVTSGTGEAIVTSTGMNTKVGKIAKMIINNETPETPLQKKLGDVR